MQDKQIICSQLTSIDYDMMLYGLIPNLESYPSYHGGEGKAYFVMDKYIVKEYIKPSDTKMFNVFFDAYCQELQNFSNNNYSVPKIYSWLKLPILQKNKKSASLTYKYYILEEQIKGRSLFLGNIEKAYKVCSDLCSETQFHAVVSNPYYNEKLYTKIVDNYIKDYILMNHTLEGMSEDEIEKMILSICNMYEEGMFSIPDLHYSNVLVGDNKLTLIDNALSYKPLNDYHNANNSKDLTLTGLIYMFASNMPVADIKAHPYFFFGNIKEETSNLLKENSMVCDEAINKVLRVAKNCLSNPKIINTKTMNQVYKMLKFILGKQKADKIAEQIQPNK